MMNKAVFVIFSASLFLGILFGSCYSPEDGWQRLVELHPELKDASLPDASTDAGRDGGTFDGGENCNIDFTADGGASLAGHWAMRLVQEGTIEPLPGTVWNLTVNDFFIADINAAQNQVVMTFANQYPKADPDNIQTSIPTKLQQALDENGVLPKIPLTVAGHFTATNIFWLWGLHVELMPNPLTDALPTKSDLSDPRIWDQDNNSKPGVSVYCKVFSPLKVQGYRYMCRRSIWQFSDGVFTTDNQWYTGGLQFVINESSLGATQALLETIAPITAKPTGSFYQLRRLRSDLDANWLSSCWQTVFNNAPGN